MSQLDPSRYRRLSATFYYAQSDGLYLDIDNSTLVLALGDAIIDVITASGSTADLEVSSEARGDILRRGASAWERHSAKTDGQILVGDGTDIKSVAVSGDASLANTGALTVTDVTVGSDAAGDLLYKSSASALARLAKGTLGQYLQMNSGATAPEWDTITAKWPFRVPAASGIDTDGYSGALAGCDQALDVTRTQASATYCKVYDDSAAGYEELETASAGDFVQWALLPSNTQNADAVLFGHTIPFCQIQLDMSATVQTYTGDATTWQYWDGNSWETLTVRDYTDATAQDGKRSFGRDGSISFTPPADWAASTIDGVNAYWVRCNAGTAANISQIGVTNSVRHYICSPADGFVVPHACTLTAVAMRDEAGTPHSTADIKFLVVNFTTGAHSGELTFAQDKRNDIFSGLSLACAASDVLGVLVRQEDGAAEMGPFTLELTVTLV